MTDTLREKLNATYNLTALEDLYLPYKRKRKTRASIAKAKGLEPLATIIQLQYNKNIEKEAQKFITEEVENIEEALRGARDIIAERVNEDQDERNRIRFIFKKEAIVSSKLVRGKEDEGKKYKVISKTVYIPKIQVGSITTDPNASHNKKDQS